MAATGSTPAAAFQLAILHAVVVGHRCRFPRTTSAREMALIAKVFLMWALEHNVLSFEVVRFISKFLRRWRWFREG